MGSPATAPPVQPFERANDEARKANNYGQWGDEDQRIEMTKHRIGIIDASRCKMSRECFGNMDLLDDQDEKCG